MSKHTKTVSELRAWLTQFMAQDEVEIWGSTNDDGTGFIHVDGREWYNS
jgi:hypothetical protein